jgi:secretion/DNA translocation related TadE-like protein
VRARVAGGLRGDDGLATVWAAGAVGVLAVLVVFGVDLGAAAVARHRVEAAADLAALAAAAHAADDEPTACAYAARTAEHMNARVVVCRLVGWEVFVELDARVALPPLAGALAHGRARAGPAE